MEHPLTPSLKDGLRICRDNPFLRGYPNADAGTGSALGIPLIVSGTEATPESRWTHASGTPSGFRF